MGDKKHKFTKADVMAVFKRHSSFTKEMSIEEFKKALDTVAAILYPNDQFSPNSRNIESKRRLLYNHLH